MVAGVPSLQADSANECSAYPRYTTDKKLIRPEGTEKWVFAGSSQGLSYSHNSTAGQQQFHNVYITEVAFDHYVATGEFPDLTMLLLDRYQSIDKHNTDAKSVLTQGSFNGARTGFEVAVKNQQRPDRRDGSEATWAYYAFGGSSTDSAAAFDDSVCQSCHEKHASEDHVWVQFYPVLRRVSRQKY